MDTPDIAVRLARWITDRTEGSQPVSVGGLDIPASNGFSNVTMVLDTTWGSGPDAIDRKLVARIEPTGDTLFPTYDVGCQFRVMAALGPTAVPVPRTLWFESDPGVLGAPFFLMEHVDGLVPSDDPSFAASGWVLALPPQRRAELCDNALQALAQVHAVDWRAVGLGWLAREGAGSTAEREISYYESFYRWAAQGRSVPVIEHALRWVRERLPDSEELVLSWGDSRVGNMIFGAELGVRAVVDWEGATLAAPEKDLGHWLQLTHVYTEQFGLALPEGFPDREGVLAGYERWSGRRVGDVAFYEVMSGIHSSIQALRALTLMGHGVGDGGALVNNPFTRGLARLVDFSLPEGGLDILTGKR